MVSRMNQETRGLELLFNISRLLSSPAPIDTALKLIMDRIAASLGILRGMITILNRASGEIGIAEAWGLDDDQKLKGRYALGEGITGRVIETGNPAAIPRIADDPRFLNRTGARTNPEIRDISFICVPIRGGAEVIGALGIDIPYQGDSLDYPLRILSIVAASISQIVQLHQMDREEMEALKQENSRLLSELKTRYSRPLYAAGNSAIMQNLYRQIEQVSNTGATVLLLGESGVGKEGIANAIHYASPRAAGPFIKINCAAIPEGLIESALFGHEAGAFTGAASRHRGYFEQAHGGSIFLDEIGDLPLAAQATLLRVLQEREFERVGGDETIKVDIRIIAAANSDLQRLMRENKFREDLYYRLSVFPLAIPPLRERKSDIVPLINHFVEKFSSDHRKTIYSVSPSAVSLMTGYSWPGNVRELENCIERAVILSTDGVIHHYHLPPVLQKNREGGAARKTLQEAVEDLERELIAGELRWTRGNISRAAENLGVSRRVLGLRMAKYGLEQGAENRE
ncbi:MAG: sigma 54-interacting transcriptional regulator [Spirochaetaceae bacterium]|jgi:Nif-specific regulatory protein|nr:sigma 54-interacting transcriptional regulator [Spirochaetaceae bacterium]